MGNKRACSECFKSLQKDEIALSKKMLGRISTEFYCLNCLSVILDCEHEDLVVKVLEFKEQGCSLFL